MKRKSFTLVPLLAIVIGLYNYLYSSSPEPVKVLFIMGGPGSGKGTQSQLISQEFDFVHLSTGDIMRNRLKQGGELGDSILSSMQKGQLVSNDIVARSLEVEFQQKGKDSIFLLDGFPRSIDNFLAYEEHTNKTLDILGIIYIECSDETMERRLVERAQKVERPDNAIETIKNRIRLFHEQTRVMLSKFMQQTVITTVSGEGSVRQVYEQLTEKMKKLGFKPVKVINLE